MIHHHDIEKHAESYNEGYADAERQATEPVQGYDEPDATNPDHLRFAADVIEQLGGRQPIKGSSAVQVRACTPNDLRDVAERIATRDLVEDITAMWADLPPHPSDLDRAAILVSQFDVTRKAGA